MTTSSSRRLLSLCCSGLLQLSQQQARGSGRLAVTTAAGCRSSSSSTSRPLLQQLGAGSTSSTRCTSSPSRGFAAGGRAPPVTSGPHQPNPNAARMPPGAGRAGGAPAGRPTPLAAAADAAAATTTTSTATPSGFARWLAAFKAVPTVPRVLGLAGAVPFLALAPPVAKHLSDLLPATMVDNCAMIQVCYGVTIVTFLGAVHWGVAMASPIMGAAAGGAVGARMANEAYVYSVLPSLVAWPVALMEPGAGSLVLSLLLPACYAADFTRRNNGLPAWYLTLRLPLTLLATCGMLLTATRHMHLEFDRARAMAADLGEQQQQGTGGGAS